MEATLQDLIETNESAKRRQEQRLLSYARILARRGYADAPIYLPETSENESELCGRESCHLSSSTTR